MRRLRLFLAVFMAFSLMGPAVPYDRKNFHGSSSAFAADYLSQPVYFNVQTFKFHKPTCRWAQRCTRSCIVIARGEAIKRSGVRCRVCGG